MATTSVGDNMQIALEDYYGSDFIGDGYMRWTAEFGPEWETLTDMIIALQSRPFADAWSYYWAAGLSVSFLLMETGDVLLLETGDRLQMG